MSEGYNKIEPRVKNVEEAVRLLTELALRAHERMDSFHANLNNLTIKVEALADAQIHAEERVKALADARIRAEERIGGFDTTLTNLATKIEALTDAQIRTEESLARLAEAQAHTDQRLDALIDIVRGRNEQ
jgi:chromosome segregation ATPase